MPFSAAFVEPGCPPTPEGEGAGVVSEAGALFRSSLHLLMHCSTLICRLLRGTGVELGKVSLGCLQLLGRLGCGLNGDLR